jgi:leucyl-tRNA synthetase
MGVPGHDERDFAFARRYGLPIKQVIAVAGLEHSSNAWESWYADERDGYLVNSGKYDGMTSEQAVAAIAADLAALGVGEKQTTYRLRDWGISRQRYWGTPIPIIHCGSCGAVPVPYQDLPVVLPEDLVPDGTGNPLAKDERFLKTSCPECGAAARRESDTMDTFVDSAWYYMRYCSPDSSHAMVDARNDYWMPMDQYIGGIEHAVLHLLYARFWTKVMRDMGLVKFDEPFTRLFTQGMLLNECFYREEPSGRTRWFYPSEIDVRYDERGKPVGAVARSDGEPVMLGGIEKMSKSKNNVVEPREVVERYGADTVRFFSMFAGPPEQSAVYSESGVEGAYRFVRRLWTYCHTHREGLRLGAEKIDGFAACDKELRRQIHLSLQQADFDFKRLQYNTVASAGMKMLNALEAAGTAREGDSAAGAARREALGILLRVLYPIIPHVTQVLWNELGYGSAFGELLSAPWPSVDPRALEQDSLQIVVQVNGKLRGHISMPPGSDAGACTSAALENEHIRKFVGDKTPRKTIYVPDRLLNLVV